MQEANAAGFNRTSPSKLKHSLGNYILSIKRTVSHADYLFNPNKYLMNVVCYVLTNSVESTIVL